MDADRVTHALDADATAVGVGEPVHAPSHQHNALASENLPASAQGRAARFNAAPRKPPSTATASPASRPMPTLIGSEGSSRVASAKRPWSATAVAGASRTRRALRRRELGHPASSRVDAFANERREHARETRGFHVASLLRKRRVPPDVRDQKRSNASADVLIRQSTECTKGASGRRHGRRNCGQLGRFDSGAARLLT
jgi:hypothetical protein